MYFGAGLMTQDKMRGKPSSCFLSLTLLLCIHTMLKTTYPTLKLQLQCHDHEKQPASDGHKPHLQLRLPHNHSSNKVAQQTKQGLCCLTPSMGGFLPVLFEKPRVHGGRCQVPQEPTEQCCPTAARGLLPAFAEGRASTACFP